MKFERNSPDTRGTRVEKINTASLLEKLEERRIEVGEEFSGLYSDYDSDMERAYNMSGTFDESEALRLGKISEALIFATLIEGEAGKHIRFRSAHPYDDIFHGIDLVAEPKHVDIPALATLDVTINQEDIKGTQRRNFDYDEIHEARPVGLERKLYRKKRYIDSLASFDPEEARNLQGWMQSGGLSSKRVSENNALFEKAEQIILMKYYKTRGTKGVAPKAQYVIGGPQIVISIDTQFVNKALQGGAGAKETLHALSFLEFVYSIHTELHYLNSLLKEERNRNLFFDTHYAKVKAWAHILEQPEIESLISTLTKKHRSDPDFVQQLLYYRSVQEKVFGQ